MLSFFRRLALDKKSLTEEMNDLDRRLHREKKERESKSSKVRHLEAELRETRSHISQKAEIGKLLGSLPGYIQLYIRDMTLKRHSE